MKGKSPKRKAKSATALNGSSEPFSGSSQPTTTTSGKSAAAETAELLGISRTKVEQALAVDKHADAETKEALDKGEMTIHGAFVDTRNKGKIKSGDTFNGTNENIEWAAYTWNPVTGCLGPDGSPPD